MTPEKRFIRWSAAIIAVWIVGSIVLCITFFVGSAVIAAVMQGVSR